MAQQQQSSGSQLFQRQQQQQQMRHEDKEQHLGEQEVEVDQSEEGGDEGDT